MKPTREDVLKAVMGMSTVVPFFPKGEVGLDIVADCVREFVSDHQQLAWFTKAVCVTMKTWDDGGIALLRAIFCTKYAPADGVPPVLDVPGLSGPDLEIRFRAMEINESDTRLEEYRRLAALTPPEERPALPEVRQALLEAARLSVEAGELPDDASIHKSPALMKGEAIDCPWCRDGVARVRSSVSGHLIHTRTEVGRVVCKNKSPYPEPAEFAAEIQTPPVDADASRTLDGGSAS